MDLTEFDRRLREVTEEDSRIRPFVCAGSPLDCRIFVVGLNPATDVPFWPYWSSQLGFDKGSWYADYLRCRKDGQPSTTRRRTDAALSAVPAARCLETNLYPTASKEFSDLPQALRSTVVFDSLITAIRPLGVLVHGADAVRHIEPRCTNPLSKHTLQKARFGYGSVSVLGGDHLTRFWKDCEIEAGLQTLVDLMQ